MPLQMFWKNAPTSRHTLRHLRLTTLHQRLPPLRQIRFKSTTILGSGLAIYQRTHPWLSSNRLQCDSINENRTGYGPQIVVQKRLYQKQSETSSRNNPPSPGEQAPPPQTRVVRDGESHEQQDSGTWAGLSTTVSAATQTVSSLGDTVVDYILPDWARLLPAFITKLQNELSLAPGSLSEEIWYLANDPESNPETIWDATVRVSNDLCKEEKAFLRNRQVFTRHALSQYLGIAEEDIHPDDIPIIAMCGSGGGLRALVAGSSYYHSTKEVGLFDCATYTAGVSGSCWLQALYYSTLTQQNHGRLIEHLKKRLGVHIAFPPAAMELITSAPTNKYLLTGLVEKARGLPTSEFGIVDLYGLLLAARLLVPKGGLAVDDRDLKLSHQRRYVDDGSNPLPIYTAVRHEIPLEIVETEGTEKAISQSQKEALFQWFEFTPYEFWCEEFEAGIPTWALGRRFENGKTVWRENGLAIPELRIPMLMGVWGSAFCATLSHYYREVRPMISGFNLLAGLDKMISERDDDLIKYHPIDPAAIPNFALGMRNELPQTCPESILQTENLQLMDAGMSNNLPIYPLLRPGRNVDILIAFDSSADCRTDNWLQVVDGYARQRGIKGWPMGAGWPPPGAAKEEMVADLESAQAGSEEEAKEKLSKAISEDDSPTGSTKAPPKDTQEPPSTELGHCNIWVGTTEERTSDSGSPVSKLVEEDWELMKSDAGITVIYFPFMANSRVEGIDPATSDFMSTWNFVYTPKQIDSVVELARANFQEGAERTKRTVRAVYERKKAKRLEKEEEERKAKWARKLRNGTAGKKLGQGDHADHFS